MKVNFHMERLSVSIKDNKDRNEIIRLTVGELKSTLTQRPGAQAIKFVNALCFQAFFVFHSVCTLCFHIEDVFLSFTWFHSFENMTKIFDVSKKPCDYQITKPATK